MADITKNVTNDYHGSTIQDGVSEVILTGSGFFLKSINTAAISVLFKVMLSLLILFATCTITLLVQSWIFA